jgi:hypothetical protein
MHSFVDNGFAPGVDFFQHLVASGDFSKDILVQLVPKSRQQPKDQLVRELSDKFEAGSLDVDALMLAFCRRPRKWLAFYLTETDGFPQKLTARDFLSEFGKSQSWYGPFRDGRTAWYVLAVTVTHWLFEPGDDAPQSCRIRWHVTVEAAPKYIALHWDGFSYSSAPTGSLHTSQFAFWQRLPTAVRALEEMLGTPLKQPNLSQLVLDQMWSKYRSAGDVRWIDRRVRAESAGVALNAHSGAVVDIDVAGLGALADRLADAVLLAIGAPESETNRRDVRDAVLQTIVKEWGTKSYECSLDRVSPQETKETKEFRGHCYFGLKGDESQDAFQHVNCFSEYGGSAGALRFLLGELGVR